MKKIQDDLLANKVPIGQKLQAFSLVERFYFAPWCPRRVVFQRHVPTEYRVVEGY